MRAAQPQAHAPLRADPTEKLYFYTMRNARQPVLWRPAGRVLEIEEEATDSGFKLTTLDKIFIIRLSRSYIPCVLMLTLVEKPPYLPGLERWSAYKRSGCGAGPDSGLPIMQL